MKNLRSRFVAYRNMPYQQFYLRCYLLSLGDNWLKSREKHQKKLCWYVMLRNFPKKSSVLTNDKLRCISARDHDDGRYPQTSGHGRHGTRHHGGPSPLPQ